MKEVLGEPGSGTELRGVLEALLGEIEGEIPTLQGRRNRLREMLSKEDLEAPDKTPRAFELAEKCLGKTPLKNLLPCFPGAGEEVGAMLESLQWPEGYMEDFMSVQKSFLRHYAGHPEEYRTVLALSERGSPPSPRPARCRTRYGADQNGPRSRWGVCSSRSWGRGCPPPSAVSSICVRRGCRPRRRETAARAEGLDA